MLQLEHRTVTCFGCGHVCLALHVHAPESCPSLPSVCVLLPAGLPDCVPDGDPRPLHRPLHLPQGNGAARCSYRRCAVQWRCAAAAPRSCSRARGVAAPGAGRLLHCTTRLCWWGARSSVDQPHAGCWKEPDEGNATPRLPALPLQVIARVLHDRYLRSTQTPDIAVAAIATFTVRGVAAARCRASCCAVLCCSRKEGMVLFALQRVVGTRRTMHTVLRKGTGAQAAHPAALRRAVQAARCLRASEAHTSDTPPNAAPPLRLAAPCSTCRPTPPPSTSTGCPQGRAPAAAWPLATCCRQGEGREGRVREGGHHPSLRAVQPGCRVRSAARQRPPGAADWRRLWAGRVPACVRSSPPSPPSLAPPCSWRRAAPS